MRRPLELFALGPRWVIKLVLAWVASPTELLLELMLEGLEVQVEQRVCQKCEQLEQALESRTDIGIAIGLLMERERVTRDVAFAMLRTTSQHTNRKLRDIAFALATGADLLATAGEACPDSSRDAVAPANGVVRRIVRLEPKDVGAGLGLAIVTGWLGGELVDRHAVAIDEGAHLDSPHSLSGQPAAEGAPRGVGATTARS